MTLAQIFEAKKLVVSCELFPPKTEKGIANMMQNVERLMAFSPDFLTCTYGAGGSSQNRTLDVLGKLKSHFDVPVASHLTLVGSTCDDLREYLDKAKSIGVDHIVALRGDPPAGAEKFEQCDGGLRYANELVELVRAEFDDFGIAVAGYPEVHQEAPSAETDLENLKRKVDAGADIIVTQLFFDNADFLRFRDQCRAIGITVPIVPGIMPVTDHKQITKIATMCGAKLPQKFVDDLEAAEGAERQFEVGVGHAVEQISGLIDEGVEGFHFYVLNKANATESILRAAEITSRINIG